ncbi:hypothetical protein CC2G_011856 [Coprinopsis cinerea AmutBmut pab1-1]|nr:hypothetical protein CC2G_011856 [Coprinopsis cinerea AmutBmut pab1-1]
MNTSTPPAPTTTNSSPTATMPTRNEDKIVNISDSTQPSHSPSASSPLPTNISQSTSNSQTPPPVTILSPSATTANSNANSAVPGPPAMAPNSATASGTSSPSTPDVDPQIIEALKSKDRIYVLKLGELMEGLIKEKRQRVDLTPATTYQRLLVHRCSAYYKLAPEADPVTKGIFVRLTPESRIPERRICELVPPESSSQPTFKIMQRSAQDRRNKSHSQAGSVAGEDADLSDVEPSESGSLGGRSNTTGSSTKKHMTIQEREAAYNEARSRIFMDFEEKEKAKEKDMSASSSSLSLNSASASSINGDASSLGDVDESVNSPTTESEWSGPSHQFSRERKDNRRGGSGNASASSSTRSFRGGYHGNGSNPSSRNSRASSPSFTYASLYEPAPTQQLYDPNQPPNQANPPYGTQYYHPFAPPGQGYVPYPGYYPPYHPYQPMPHDPHHHHPSDPSPPRNMEHYPPQPAGYHYPMWQQPNQPQMHPPAPVPPHQAPGHPATSPPHSPPQYPYMGPGYGYPMPGYYPQPPGQPMTSQPPPPGQVGVQGQIYDPNRPVNGPAGPQGGPNAPLHPPHGHNTSHQNGRAPMPHGALQPNGRNPPLRNNSGPAGNGGNRVKTNPSMGRNPWSHGPGVGSGGYPVPSNPNNADVVGPRLTSSRRQANLSGGSSTANSRTSSNNNDDGLSTASSSTTSSSSRRTYTSTASSQHPLPARPDWAVGLKAQPTLARTHDHTSTRHLPPMSPTRSVNGSGKTPPVSLQSTDFPPLTSSGSLAEKRHPIPSGAWGNTSNRSVLAAPGSNNGVDGERNSSHLSLKVCIHSFSSREMLITPRSGIPTTRPVDVPTITATLEAKMPPPTANIPAAATT